MGYHEDGVMKVFLIGLFAVFAVGIIAISIVEAVKPPKECKWRQAQVLFCDEPTNRVGCVPEPATICVQGEK